VGGGEVGGTGVGGVEGGVVVGFGRLVRVEGSWERK